MEKVIRRLREGRKVGKKVDGERDKKIKVRKWESKKESGGRKMKDKVRKEVTGWRKRDKG